MFLPRGSVANPVSDKTVAGEPASYSCSVGCGIGIAAAKSIGMLLALGLWCWYWLRKPTFQSPEEMEAERSRFEFLTRKPSKRESWVKRASSAIITPLSPAVLKRMASTDDARHSPEGRARLIKNMAPMAEIERYRPATAPVNGSFPAPDDAFMPPKTIKARKSEPHIRVAGRELFVNCPAERLQRAPWADGAFFVHNSCHGKRLQRKQPERLCSPAQY